MDKTTRTPRLIHLADYGGPYPGSLIPMLSAVFQAARLREWSVTAVFGAEASGHSWVSELSTAGIDVRFIELAGTRSIVKRISILLDEDPRPTVVHTHFSSFDIPVALAVIGRPHTVLFWHAHSPLHTGRWRSLRNTARFAIGARPVAGVLCVSPDIARAVRDRGCPTEKVILFPNAIDAERFPLISPEERRSARARARSAPGAGPNRTFRTSSRPRRSPTTRRSR